MEQASETPQIIATCYLHEAGDEQNKLWLSPQHLQVWHRGRLRVFSLEQLRRLEFNHRKLMLPLVLGAIAASLSLVAIFKTHYNPILMLCLLVAGCLAAYRGYQGNWVLTIEESKTYTDYYLSSVSPNLRAFVAYANTFTGRQPKGLLYLPLTHDEWGAARERGQLGINRPQRLYYRQELRLVPAGKPVIVPIDSLRPEVQLGWQQEEETAVPVPFLQKGRLPVQELKPSFH